MGEYILCFPLLSLGKITLKVHHTLGYILMHYIVYRCAMGLATVAV